MVLKGSVTFIGMFRSLMGHPVTKRVDGFVWTVSRSIPVLVDDISISHFEDLWHKEFFQCNVIFSHGFALNSLKNLTWIFRTTRKNIAFF